MKAHVIALAVVCIGVGSLDAAEKRALNPAEKREVYEDLITAAPLPAGYKLTRKDIKDRDKQVATALLVSKEGAASRVIVTIENRELPTKRDRVDALKAYVYAYARAASKEGLRLVAKEIPDIAKADVSKPVTVKLTYEAPHKGRLLVQIRVFFTKIGYSTMVLANSEEDFTSLTKWAASVKEK